MHGSADRGLYIESRADGVYLIVDNTVAINPAIVKNPMLLFEVTEVSEVDKIAIAEALKDRDRRVEVKISKNPRLVVKNEEIKVEVSKDLMEAKVSFSNYCPWFGAKLTVMDIVNALKSQNIVHGILTDAINMIQVNRPPAGTFVQVAAGRPPVQGENGFLTYAFDIDNQDNKPKLLDNGSVDYKNVESILQAKMGDVLVTVEEAKPGVDGINVKGEKTPVKPGKAAPRLPRGKNTSISLDEKQLIADVDGQIQINGGRIDVLPCLTIAGDVGFTTGNINFTGSVVVQGTVLNGFSVKTTENIDVSAAVEGANLDAGGNINLIGGIKGVGKSVITAGGNIFARYIERATLISGGDIVSDSIMHSNIQCGGHLTIGGRKGLLVGGTTYATKSVTAKVIGSSMSTATEITVGTSPDFIIRYKELEEKYKKIKDEYDKERLVEAYKAANEDLKMRSLHARIHLRVEMDKILKEMNALLVMLNSKEGVVRVSQIIHHGCKIVVGGVMMKVNDELIACTLRNVDERISVGPYIAY